nr:hypothetical protein [Candidatus Sigynarchaeota archaeon]
MDPLGTLIGIMLGIGGACLFNYAPVLKKEALNTLDELTLKRFGSSIKILITSKGWMAGIIMSLVGTALFTISASILGLLTVVPLMSFGVVILVIYSVKHFHERLHARDFLGIVFVVSVPVFLALSEIGDVQANIETPAVFIAFLLASIVIVLVAIIPFLVNFKLGNKRHSGLIYAISSGMTWGVGTFFIQATLGLLKNAGIVSLLNIAQFFSVFMTFNEHVVASIIVGISGLLIIVMSTFMQQIALQRTKLAVASPISQTIINIISITGGITIFGQPIGNPFFYVISFCFAICGTFLLSKFQKQDQAARASEIQGTGQTTKT